MVGRGYPQDVFRAQSTEEAAPATWPWRIPENSNNHGEVSQREALIYIIIVGLIVLGIVAIAGRRG